VNRSISVALAGLAVVMLFAGSAFAATQSSNGFATYKISVISPMGVHSVLVSETVKSADKAGFSDLTLQISGTTQNLTYSRIVNSSSVLLPYLPPIPGQAFDYSNKSLSVHANVTQAGTQSVNFQGKNYTLSVYDITLSGTYGNRTFSATGTIQTFPSTLVYGASLSSGIAGQVLIVLQGTDLPLDVPSSAMATAAVAGAGIGVVGVAAAATLFVRRRDRQAKAQEQKPLHWVD